LQPGLPENGDAAGVLQPDIFSEDPVYDLILAISYPPYTLSSGFLAVQHGEHYFLPFLELANIFDFYVHPDTEDGVYGGYFKDEKSSFTIDTQKNEIEVVGEISSLPPGAVIIDPFDEGNTDPYVRMDVLNKIWPTKLSVDMAALTLVVATDEKLAFELKLERKESRALTMGRKAYSSKDQKENLPFKDNPYKFIGLPVIDMDSQYRWDNENKVLAGRTTFSGLQDLAWATADYAATVSYEEGRFHRPDTIRLRFSRDAVGDETLPLGFRQAEAGDTRVTHRSLIGNSTGGRGAAATSYPASRESEFDQITVEGFGIVGWEAELYRNNILEDFQVIDESGEYRFEGVPLIVGNNQLRVVLYGPQGQVQERIENYKVSGGMTAPGKTDYSVSVVDAQRPFVMITGGHRTSPRGIAANAFVAHGLNPSLTVFGSLSKLPTIQEEKSYASVGVMGTFLNSFGQAEIYKESHGGHALDMRFATKIKGLSLNLQSAFFRNFESPEAGFDNNIKTFESEARANTSIKTLIGNLGLQLVGKHRENKIGLPFSSINFQQSLGLSGAQLTHSTNSTFNDYIHETSAGKLSATVRIQRWQLRSNLNYDIHPIGQLRSVSGEARYRDQDGFSAAVNAQHNFLSRGQSAGFQLGYDFGKVLGSLDLNWVKEGGYNVSLRASTSLGPYGRDGKYDMSSKKMSRNTPLQGRAFLDNDGDGVFSEGDEPVPDAQLLIDGRSAKESGDEDGYVLVRSGRGGSVVNVELNESSLSDPYYQPAIVGYSTVLRPGSMPVFEFPVIETGAIDGTVYRESGSSISGMRLELVSEGGDVVQTTETAYDGFYTFDFVPVGTYTVRADPSYGINVPPETVTVTSDDLFTYGIDLQLLEQAEEVEAADEEAMGDEPTASDDAVTESGRVAHTHHERSNGTLQPAPLSTEGDLSAFVKRVRIGEHPDKVRLVLDLSGPIVYSMVFAGGGQTLNIDLPDVAWDAIRHWRGARTPVIESFEALALPEGGTRLVVQGRGALASGLNGVLKPQNGQGYRLFIDLHTH